MTAPLLRHLNETERAVVVDHGDERDPASRARFEIGKHHAEAAVADGAEHRTIRRRELCRHRRGQAIAHCRQTVRLEKRHRLRRAPGLRHDQFDGSDVGRQNRFRWKEIAETPRHGKRRQPFPLILPLPPF